VIAAVRRRSAPAHALAAGAVAAVAGGWLGGPVAAFAAGAYAALGVHGARRVRRGRAQAQLRSVALDAMSGLADDVRAGAPAPVALNSALRAMAEAADGRTAGELLAVGSAGPGAHAALALRTVSEPALRGVLTPLAAVWALLDHGVPLADLVERLDAELRTRTAASQRAAAQLAGARATAVLLGALPCLGLLLGQFVGAHPLAEVLTTRLGGACAVAAVTLQVTGVLWSGRITRATAP
jgi:tight adherence protein B